MTPKRIFVTGASGCIGHYLVEALIQETDHELFLLVRNPDKLKINVQARSGVTILQSDLCDIEQYSDLLKTMNCAVLAATAWGGDDVQDINILRNLQLIRLLDPTVCEQVLYFSTASILARDGQLLPEAIAIGSDYVRSKYVCYEKLAELKSAPKIITLFPTFVLGGGELTGFGEANRYPASHLSSGIADVAKWTSLIRFFQADGSFHFIHGRDIAQVVRHLIDHPLPESQNLVLGNEKITVNQAIADLCAYLNYRIYFQIPLLWLLEVFVVLFRIQIDAWERFCLQYRHFTYENPINPATFGLTVYCATMYDVLKLSGIPKPQKKFAIRNPKKIANDEQRLD